MAIATLVPAEVICNGTATGWIERFALNMPATASIKAEVISRGTATGWVERSALKFPVTANIKEAVICRGSATGWVERLPLNLPATAYVKRPVVLLTTAVRVPGVCHHKRRDSHQEQYQREFRNTTPETCYKTRRSLIEIEQFL